MNASLLPGALAALATSVALAASACAAQPVEDDPQAFVIAAILEEAELENVADIQLEVLRASVSTGEVTVQQLAELHAAHSECLEDAGWTVTPAAPMESPPGSGLFTFPAIAIPPSGLSEHAELGTSMHCNEQYWMFARAAYNASPNAMYWRDLPWEDPKVIECLRNRGYDVADDATGTEINFLATEDALANQRIQGYVMCDPYPR